MNTHSDQSTGSKTSSQDSETNAEAVPKGENNSDDQSTGSKTSSQDSEQPDAEEVANGRDNSNVMNTHSDQSTGSKTSSQDSETNAEEVPKGKNNSDDQSTGSKTSSQDSEQPDAEEVANGTPPKKDTTVATVHLKVVWPEGEPPPKWEKELQKALQSWFNKNPKNRVTTECSKLTGQMDGSVRLEITPATGQEDLFTDDTQLTLKDQTTASVRRLNGGGSARVHHYTHPSWLIPSAPPKNNSNDQSTGSKTSSQDSEQPDAEEVPNGTLKKKDKPVATVHLKVVWPEGEPPSRWETELQKALQSWFNKHQKSGVTTKCLNLTGQKDGSVRLELIPATGQEDLFTDDTQLTLRDQKTTASVRRLNGGGSAPVTHDNDTPRLLPSAPPEPVSCTVLLAHFWYVNQVYREKMKRIEEKNGVHIQKDVKVSFNGDTSAGADPVKALSEFTDLVQSCLGDSTCYSYCHEPGQVDWEKALQLIQQGREKLTLTVSPHEVEVCGPMKSLKTFETISKMKKKILNTPVPGPSSAGEAQGRSQRVSMNFRDPLLSSGLAIDPVHWVVITTLFKTKLAELENRFGVKFCYTTDKVKARAEMSKDAVTMESHALRALLCLYQRVTTSVLSCSLQSQSESQSLVGQRLAGIHGVVPDICGDQWRIIGLPEDLRRAVDHIESDLGRPVFREEDRQRIGHRRYGVDSSGGSDMAGGEPPVRGAPAAEEEEDKCPVCMDQFTNRTTLPCNHALCTECLENLVRKMGPTCPICKANFGEITGDQPDGSMTYETQRTSLPGFWRYGHLLIKYEIPSGKQTARHPNPGRPYHGTQRSAYLPDNREGREVLRLLQRAFDKKLIFTVGTSRTSGSEDQVTWNDIHHKTSIGGGPTSFGYPDPDYLRRVKEELKAKGIE
ncbi:E3 ubiquitin-protein ligase DTX3L isoform X9 [Gadus morhua]|uniref:E3 ubiquitin-protein ligase DTX3L isoform X9 n=1 Tax=Gadus morhua TaxID=8049 RepID=UPI0011B57AD8|nr:E3 ubiquitin-protein ligase DTX3L-like isoform X9 [Gadus morhua]